MVQTRDGYLLCLHRICKPKGDIKQRSNGQPNGQHPIVYFHHGLLMNSEVWVCQMDAQNSLAFQLVEEGYDCWVRCQLYKVNLDFTNRNSLETTEEIRLLR